MEFPFDCAAALDADEQGYAIIDSKTMKHLLPNKQASLVIDTFGQLSAKGLKAVITTTAKMLDSDQRLYFKVESGRAVGLLKVGPKRLFIRDYVGTIVEMTPLCVLDFYVHESVQRSGHGRAMFEKMLENENANPARLGYDRPSPKLLAFLKKHYGLVDYIPQNNNYVVYNDYFDPATAHTYVKRSYVPAHPVPAAAKKPADESLPPPQEELKAPHEPETAAPGEEETKQFLERHEPPAEKKEISRTEAEIKELQEKIQRTHFEEPAQEKTKGGYTRVYGQGATKGMTTSSAYGSCYSIFSGHK